MARILVAGAMASLAAITLAACRSDADSAGGSPGGTSAVTGTSTGSPTPASTGAATAADPMALCAGIPAADVAALFSTPVGAAQKGSGPVTCYFAPTGKTAANAQLSLVIDPAYGAATYSGQVAIIGAGPQPLSGVGDKASWASPQKGYAAPGIASVKDTVGCTIISPSDVSVLALDGTTKNANGTTLVGDDTAAAFAQKLGVLCADIFAGK